MDNKLLFSEHIAKRVGTANRNLGLIFEIFEFMDKDMFLYLYKSLVRKVTEKSRECHNHKPQPFPDTKRKRKTDNTKQAQIEQTYEKH